MREGVESVKNITKWYDPICYQFSFYMLGNKAESWHLIEATKSFIEELIPYYHLWMDLQGTVMISSTTSNGKRIRIGKNPEMLHDFCNILEQQSHALHGIEIALVPDKTQSKFSVSVKTLSELWRHEVLQYTDVKDPNTLDASQKTAWLCRMLNCPTDDLEGICYPQKCFETKGIPLRISYGRWDSLQILQSYIDGAKKNVVSSNDQGVSNDEYLHCIHISLPRCMLKYANQSFGLQNKWEERLLLLCNTYSGSFGCIKMDRYKTNCVSPLLTGNGCFIPSFRSGIPDVAWGICLNQHQTESLAAIDKQSGFSIFDQVLPLSNGHLYLRLTPDVSVVPMSKAKELWGLLCPQLCINAYTMNSLRDVPVSFRLGIDSDNLQIDEYGYYRITR